MLHRVHDNLNFSDACTLASVEKYLQLLLSICHSAATLTLIKDFRSDYVGLYKHLYFLFFLNMLESGNALLWHPTTRKPHGIQNSVGDKTFLKNVRINRLSLVLF
jgi:hypothetical protein